MSTTTPDGRPKLPTFLIIGAAKAGTTALAAWLEQHPEIYFTPFKEPMFFAREGMELDFAGPGDLRLPIECINNLRDYEAQYDGVRNEKAMGEKSTCYLRSPDAAASIKHYVPNVKLVAVLRDPAARAFSHFMHFIRDDREPLRDFEKALDQEPARIAAKWEASWQYQETGFYHRQLSRYYALFPREQIRVYLHEDLRKPDALLPDLFRYLGVDPSFQPQTEGRHNASGVPKNRSLHEWLMYPNWPKWILKRVLPSALFLKLKRLQLWAVNRNLVSQNIQAPALARLRDLYREDTLRLQELIGRDLSKWLTT